MRRRRGAERPGIRPVDIDLTGKLMCTILVESASF